MFSEIIEKVKQKLFCKSKFSVSNTCDVVSKKASHQTQNSLANWRLTDYLILLDWLYKTVTYGQFILRRN